MGEEFGFDCLPLGLRITYGYFKGRYHMYNNEYAAAREYLKNSFTLCD